jgi:hypothetical protein
MLLLGVIDSMVNSMRELLDLYDIMMFFRNNTVANSGVSGSRVNIAAIPKALGKTFDQVDEMGYAQKART